MNNDTDNLSDFFLILKFIFQAKHVRITATTIAVLAFSIAAFNNFPESPWSGFGLVMAVLAFVAFLREAAINEGKRNG